NVGNLNGYNAVQNVGNQVAQNQEFRMLEIRMADLDEIEEVNANCILMANLQQASTSGTQTDKAPVYDSEGSAEVHDYENCDDNEIFNMFTQEEQYTELLEPIPEPHQVPHNENNVISEVTSAEQSKEIVEQHPANFEETRNLRVFETEGPSVLILVSVKCQKPGHLVCMSTRSSTRNLFPPLENPELTIRRRIRVDPNLLNDFNMATNGKDDNQPPPDGGDLPVPDLRTMEELCQPTLNGHGTLPSTTITNPKEDLKGITTRSGIAYKGPTIPTTFSPLKVVEHETEVTNDTVPPTNNGSTKDVQPLVVQIETQVPNSEPVVALVVEPVEALIVL
nr:reverse transcriptase domain-containing protein [Tanacetum cinerariifolium]